MLGFTKSAAVAFLITSMVVNGAQPRAVTDIIAASTIALGLHRIGKGITRSAPEFRELRKNLAHYSIAEKMDQMTKTLTNAPGRFPELESFAWGMENLGLELAFVEAAFNNTIELLEAGARGDDVKADVFHEFGDKFLSDDDGLPARLRSARILLFYGENAIVPILVNQMQAQKLECTSSLSHQQHLYQMLTHMLVMELKGYVAMQYYLQLQRNTTGSNFTFEENYINEGSARRVSYTVRKFRRAMKKVSRTIWRCDPPKHKEDETYTELKSVFSRIILHENDLNKEQFTCHANCEVFKENSTYQCSSQTDICAMQRGCKKVEDCGTMDRSKVCLSDSVHSTKRYQFVDKYERSWRNLLQLFYDLFHINQKCPSRSISTEAYTRGIGGEVCLYCGCICTESSDESDRYFNLRPVESDVEKNFVVTGMRFEKKHHVVHIQIQQGQLTADGMANSSTVHWKNIDAYVVNENDGENGVKYHKLEWFGKRKVVLDDIESPESHVVTGVRFVAENYGSGVHLKLQLRSTPYDFSTGQLAKERSVWHSGAAAESERTELQLNGHKHPIHSGGRSIINSKNHQYLQFYPTDILTEDAGQSTIPFLDLQSVSSHSAITGVGLIHKAAGQSGGYLALKLNTFDAAPRLDVLVEQMRNLQSIGQS